MVELEIIPKFRKVGNVGIEHIGNIGFNYHFGHADLEVWLNAHGFVTYMVNNYSTNEYKDIRNRYEFFKDINEVDILTSLFRLRGGDQ